MTDTPPPREVIGRASMARNQISRDAIADETLAALTTAGYVVVPREPTDEMHGAGNRIWGESVTAIYRAMIAAATPGDGEPT